MVKVNDKNYQVIRRYVIVQMNKAGVTPLNIARTLRDLTKLEQRQIDAIADAIASKQYREFDLNHDIMGVLYDDLAYFVPRIKAIAEVF